MLPDNENRRYKMHHLLFGSQVAQIVLLMEEIILLSFRILWIIATGLYRLFIPVSESSVKGEIVLITGAGHGIGKQLALQYAFHGATVICLDVNESNNKNTVKEIAQLGYSKAYDYTCNITERNQVLNVVKKIQQEVGDVTILINNAGIMPCHQFLEHTEEEIKRILDVNVLGHFWTLQAILPIMLKNNKGHIVAVSSCCGLRAMKYLVPYCASKYAVRGMMDALDRELKVNPECQIKLTTIYPYMVDTGLCKKPKIRFPSITPMLRPCDVAKYIVAAQRREMVETTVPRYLLSLVYYRKLFPVEVERITDDFMNIYVETD